MTRGGDTSPGDPRWEDPEIVAEFVAREPDARLVRFLDEHSNRRLRVLDLGCAGGRNTVLLARRGCDVMALDLSAAMVAATRRRLAEVVGFEEAERRVLPGSMTELPFEDGSFDLIVALGIYHQAHDLAEWHRALSESVRVLRHGGHLLSASFGPGTDLTGEHGQAVDGAPYVFIVRDGSRAVLLTPNELDAMMSRHDLHPVEPTVQVTREHKPAGARVTINALHRLG